MRATPSAHGIWEYPSSISDTSEARKENCIIDTCALLSLPSSRPDHIEERVWSPRQGALLHYWRWMGKLGPAFLLPLQMPFRPAITGSTLKNGSFSSHFLFSFFSWGIVELWGRGEKRGLRVNGLGGGVYRSLGLFYIPGLVWVYSSSQRHVCPGLIHAGQLTSFLQ